MGKLLNSCLDAGLKAVLPSMVDDEVIEIKNAIIEGGLEGGVKELTSYIKDFGKSAFGLVTGNFESVSQIKLAVKNGGVIDLVSDIIDFAVDKAVKDGNLSKDISKTIKKGKDAMLKDFSKNISDELLKEQKTLEKAEKHIAEWKEKYNEKDFEEMEKIYKKINRQIDKVFPIKNIVEDAKTIENLHNLIKNNEGNFELSEDKIELAKKL